jgi:ABC-type bacteriocin/lantibiotic exporter with double-glycine peptidase domain
VTAAACLELAGVSLRFATAAARLLPTTPIDGADPRSLESLFRRAGFPAQSGEMDWRDLAYHTSRGRPVACLVQLEGCGHWVAVWRASSRRVSWHCPEYGPRSATPAEFRRGWWDWSRDGVDYRCFGVAVGAGRKG